MLSKPWEPKNAKWSLVNLVQTSRLQTKTEDLRRVVLRQRWGLDILESSPCLSESAIIHQISQIKTESNLDYKEYDWIPHEDLELGLELYSYLHYCQSDVVEAAQLSVFFEALLSNHSLGTLVASTMNNLQPRVGHNLLDLTSMNMWFEQLDKEFDFSLGLVLAALSTTTELKRLKDLDPPFLRMHFDIIDLCIQKNDCEDLFQDLTGKIYSKQTSLIHRRGIQKNQSSSSSETRCPFVVHPLLCLQVGSSPLEASTVATAKQFLSSLLLVPADNP